MKLTNDELKALLEKAEKASHLSVKCARCFGRGYYFDHYPLGDDQVVCAHCDHRGLISGISDGEWRNDANPDTIKSLATELLELREESEKLRVQLAGCSSAALGYDGDCKPGDYGWSASLGDVLQLRESDRRKTEAISKAIYRIEFLGGIEDSLMEEIRAALITNDHADHGRGTPEEGPDEHDCSCRGTNLEGDCAKMGCGFCLAARRTWREGCGMKDLRLMYLKSWDQAEQRGGDIKDCLLHYLSINLEMPVINQERTGHTDEGVYEMGGIDVDGVAAGEKE